MKRLVHTVICIFILLAFQCTNPFNARTPEPPDVGTQAVNFGVQTSPDSLMSKLRRSFRPDGATSYIECIDDSFEYVPEQDALDRIRLWSRNSEEQYFRSFINAENLQQATLEYTDTGLLITADPVSPNIFRAEFNYLIEAEFNQSTRRYQGRSILSIVKSTDTELWFVRRWEDFKADANQVDGTWSTLRAEFQL